MVRKTRRFSGIKTQRKAMESCGMPPEFASHLLLQCYALNVSIILRAGDPPAYNQKCAPKSGVNLSKTSRYQGFFNGFISEDERFTRLKLAGKNGKSTLIGHHDNDIKRLAAPVRSVDYQHCIPLTVTVPDLIKQVSRGGDLKVLRYQAHTRQLHLTYRENRGSPGFKGQFILQLSENVRVASSFYSRPWDKPSRHPDWDSINRVIRKPSELRDIPEEEYRKIFDYHFHVYFSETQSAVLSPQELNKAYVFAHTPQTAEAFLEAMGETHPRYAEVQNIRVLKDILQKLTDAEILEIYDRVALGITGDWDGLALGFPPGVPERYTKEYNTFANRVSEKNALMVAVKDYFVFLRAGSLAKKIEERNAFDNLLLTTEDPGIFISDFALEHAGCITPHEFLFQQMVNYTYRLQDNSVYGEKSYIAGLQQAMEKGLKIFFQNEKAFPSEQDQRLLAEEVVASWHDILLETGGKLPNGAVLELLDEHLEQHFQNAIALRQKNYVIPHPDYDPNVHDLFQHGFDMRNPYGCNLAGAWFLITPEGELLYGKTQEALAEWMLHEDFLKKNFWHIHFSADMASGWGRVIEKQLSLGQTVTPQTMDHYKKYLDAVKPGFFSGTPQRPDSPQKEGEEKRLRILF